MKWSIKQLVENKPWAGWLLFFITVVVVFFLGLLASSIMERRAEAQFVYTPKVEFDSLEPRNEIWGENFPREYATYLQTSDTTFKSLFNGNGLNDALKEDPDMIILWAGYAFSKDYNQPRGHFYAITDIRNTLRTGAPNDTTPSPQPNTCWTCKSPDVPRLMAKMGIQGFYNGSWEQLGSEVVNAIGCSDCHDSKNMNLKITRPALIEAFQRQGKDISKSTQQEMRTLVCAQCHVEYFFDSRDNKHKYLTFPWDSGMTVESMEKYYDNFNFSDWTHAISKAPMLKAQHPDYEVFKLGVHYRAGLACADCHMPYISEGGIKFTDHHVQSPLNNISRSCQVCHRESEEELRERVYQRQRNIKELRTILEKELVNAHFETKHAWDIGAKEEEMKNILKLIRQAQWRWDFAVAGHGNSFHAPLEVARVLAHGINKAQEARRLLTRIFAQYNNFDVKIPDISTKALAQKAIGLDMEKLKANKEVFKNTVVPKWLEKAKERESKYTVKHL
ncbi:MAG: ammonia-forming cytochrome c nitrite reductase [Bacteroidales bacterium]|jgi:nitrite reductase (cytochrome c-552)|nr:ammonia-forming cytochrome c nitrite reductase [Bacteroidales bacterium]